jgi:3-oxoacyl-[acyl-carrier protein] reductase
VRGLSGLRVVLSGGSSGIGYATCERLLAEGARVALCAPTAQEASEAAEKLGGQAVGIACDVGEEAQVEAFVAAAAYALGGVDACVANAGTSVQDDPLAARSVDLDMLWRVNARGAFLLAQGCARLIESGSIVFTSSVNARFGQTRSAGYDASKAAMEGFVRSLAVDLGTRGIRVNAVAPGFIVTPLGATVFDRYGDYLARHHTLLGRLGDPSEVAAAIAFLLSDDSSYVTGATLVVDGGRTTFGFPPPAVDWQSTSW